MRTLAGFLLATVPNFACAAPLPQEERTVIEDVRALMELREGESTSARFHAGMQAHGALFLDVLMEEFSREGASFGPRSGSRMRKVLRALHHPHVAEPTLVPAVLRGLRAIDEAPYDTDWDMSATRGRVRAEVASFEVRRSAWNWLQVHELVENIELVPDVRPLGNPRPRVEQGLLIALLEQLSLQEDPIERRWMRRAAYAWAGDDAEFLKHVASLPSSIQEEALELVRHALLDAHPADRIMEGQLDVNLLEHQIEGAVFLAREAPRTLPQLIRGLDHEIADVRALCAEGLVRALAPSTSLREWVEVTERLVTEYLPDLARASEDEDWRVRVFLTRLLRDLVREYTVVEGNVVDVRLYVGKRKPMESVRGVMEARAADEHPTVRYWAREGLRELDRDAWHPLRVLSRQKVLGELYWLDYWKERDREQLLRIARDGIVLDRQERRSLDPGWFAAVVLICWHREGLDDSDREMLMARWRDRVEWLVENAPGGANEYTDELCALGLCSWNGNLEASTMSGFWRLGAAKVWGRLRGFVGPPHVELVHCLDLLHGGAWTKAVGRLSSAENRAIAVPFLVAGYRYSDTGRPHRYTIQTDASRIAASDPESVARYLEDPSPDVRIIALRGLGAAGARARPWREVVSRMAEESTDPEVRSYATRALRSIPE